MSGITQGTAPKVVPRGTHALHCYGGASWNISATEADNWSLAYDDVTLARVYGGAPSVSSVSWVSTAPDEASIATDSALIPDVAYTLTAAPYAGNTAPPPGADFAALRPSVPVRPELSGVLLDVDAPLLRPDGSRGGDYRLNAAGDRALSGGRATVEKAIFHAVLRDASPLRLKAPRPTDIAAEERRLRAIVEAIPYIRSAGALLTFGSDMMTITITAQTDFGVVSAVQEVSRG